MALEIQSREHENIIILDLKGRITVGPEATALREKVAALVGGRKPEPGAQSASRWITSIPQVSAPW